MKPKLRMLAVLSMIVIFASLSACSLFQSNPTPTPVGSGSPTAVSTTVALNVCNFDTAGKAAAIAASVGIAYIAGHPKLLTANQMMQAKNACADATLAMQTMGSLVTKLNDASGDPSAIPADQWALLLAQVAADGLEIYSLYASPTAPKPTRLLLAPKDNACSITDAQITQDFTLSCAALGS